MGKKPARKISQSRRDAVRAGETHAGFGRLVGLSRQAVRKAIATGRIRPGRGLLPSGRIDPAAASRALRETTDPSKQRGREVHGGSDRKKASPDLYAAKARREDALADIAEMEREQARRNTVLVSEVKTGADEAARRLKERILAVPERVMDVLESLGIRDTLRARKALNDELRLALELTADELPKATPAIRGGRSAPAPRKPAAPRRAPPAAAAPRPADPPAP